MAGQQSDSAHIHSVNMYSVNSYSINVNICMRLYIASLRLPFAGMNLLPALLGRNFKASAGVNVIKSNCCKDDKGKGKVI